MSWDHCSLCSHMATWTISAQNQSSQHSRLEEEDYLNPWPNNWGTKSADDFWRLGIQLCFLLLFSGPREHFKKRGQKNCKNRDFSARFCLLVISGATPIGSHQHDCLNVSWTRMMPGNMPNWTGRIPRGSQIYAEL